MKINADRLWDLHRQLESFTDPEHPYTRRSFSTRYAECRDWLQQRYQESGMSPTIDAAGNLTGIYRGSGARKIAVGSHTDTVPGGGRFDGITGVLSFIEAIRCMKDAGFVPEKSIVGIDFLAEEPSEFGLSCIGSRLATGNFTPEMLDLRHEKTNRKLRDAIDEWGGNSSRLAPGRSLFEADRFDGFLELHIEQGPVLEKERLDIGLVKGICSVTRYNCAVQGKADHAGNTPMDVRSDAMEAAAKTIAAIYRAARTQLSQKAYFTATVGKLEVRPNGSNVIADTVEFSLDIRSESNRLVDESLETIVAAANQVAQQTRTHISFTKISRNKPAVSDETLLTVLEQTARHLGLKTKRMLSGAGHDAAYLSTIMPMAMIFIPCREGLSHAPTEFSSKQQVEKGADLLLNTLVSLSS